MQAAEKTATPMERGDSLKTLFPLENKKRKITKFSLSPKYPFYYHIRLGAMHQIPSLGAMNVIVPLPLQWDGFLLNQIETKLFNTEIGLI